jgi:hypothetical protein
MVSVPTVDSKTALDTDLNSVAQLSSNSSMLSSIGQALVTIFNSVTGAINLTLNSKYGILQEGLSGDATINSATIQAALTDAKSNVLRVKAVHLPAGVFMINTIYVPEGVKLTGAGHHIEVSSAAATRLVASTAGVDMIRGAGHIDPANGRRFWYGEISNLSLFGNKIGNAGSTVTTGNGIAFYDVDGNTLCPQDTSYIHDITIRGMPDNGIICPDGGIPGKFARIKTWFNGKAGIRIVGGTSKVQAIDLDNITGDRNIDGLIVLDNFDSRGNVVIRNFKSEMAINTLYDSVDAQLNAIVINNCEAGSVFTVLGGDHVSSIPDQGFLKKPGDVIKVNGSTTPHIEWIGVQARIASVNDTGTDPYVISNGSDVLIPYTIKSGSWSVAPMVWRSSNGSRKFLIGNTNTFIGGTGVDNAMQISGSNPGFGLYQSNGATDAKKWFFALFSGTMQFFTESDSGTRATFLTAQRTGNAVTRMELVAPLMQKGLPKASVIALTPATYSGYLMYVSDPAATKGHLVYCNGTSWLYDSDDSVVS